MELLLPQPTLQRLFLPSNFMYPLSLSSKLLPKSLLFSPQFRLLCSSSLHLNNPSDSIPVPNGNKRVWRNGDGSRVCEAKEKWLSSLSSPFPFESEELCDGERNINGGGDWVVGVDPDASGALALLKPDRLGCSAEVFDSPYVQVSVGKRTRRRLDAKSIVELVQSFNAAKGTTAYIEQSNPYPKDGKQGWWSGGFGYGLWIGILVASGFSVVPVPSQAWKKAFDLAGSCSSKDNSRRLASDIFPMLSPMLKRKKDHGRAEALLIAVYGKGLKTKVDEYESQL